MTDVFKIAEILVSHAVQAHAAEIAIIAYYGSYARGQASPTSDLDIYYIPDEGQAESLSSQFVIDGLPYDFWGVPWALLENIANGSSARPWSVAAALVADTRVLYHRSQADLDRFNALKARVAKLTQPESRDIMVGRALDEFKTTLFQLGQMRLAIAAEDVPGMRWASWKFLDSAVNCLALVNQTYFSKGWAASMSELLAIAQIPVDLEGLINAILMAQDPEHMLAAADGLAADVRGILRTAQASLAEPAAAQDVFRDFYYYVFEYKNKVLSACERRDVMAARSAAFHMQEQICQLMNKVENGFYPTGFNLLGEYLGGYEEAGFPDLLEAATHGDFETLARRVQELDEIVQEWFTELSIALNILETEDDLRRFLNQRDPVL
jgi:hypothetical protein